MAGSRRWINLTLGLAAIALTLLLVFPPSEESPALRPVSSVEPGTVTKVELRNSAGEQINFGRKDGAWWLTLPTALPANALKVAALASITAAHSLSGFRAAGNDLAQFGLAPPLAEVVVGAQHFALGSTEPLDGRRYLLHDGEVHLVEDGYFQFIDAGVASFVHPAPLAAATRVLEVRIDGRYMRWDGQAWHSQGYGDPGADRLNEVAEDWLTAQAITVRPFAAELEWPQALEVKAEGRETEITFALRFTAHEAILGRRDLGIEYHMLRRPMGPLLGAPDAS